MIQEQEVKSLISSRDFTKHVSRETIFLLEEFTVLLKNKNEEFNLIGPGTLNDIWERHIIDSLQLIKYIPDECKVITDIGTGGGMPGIILAAMRKWNIHIVESNNKKCEFLKMVSNVLLLDTTIHKERAENIKNPWQSDVITARAVAPLDQLLFYTQNLIKKSKFCLFLKGETALSEIEIAQRNWNFEYELFSSVTNENSKIVKLYNLEEK